MNPKNLKRRGKLRLSPREIFDPPTSGILRAFVKSGRDNYYTAKYGTAGWSTGKAGGKRTTRMRPRSWLKG
ncbi:hypothetical protein ES708_30990 [subsurface metagenome]